MEQVFYLLIRIERTKMGHAQCGETIVHAPTGIDLPRPVLGWNWTYGWRRRPAAGCRTSDRKESTMRKMRSLLLVLALLVAGSASVVLAQDAATPASDTAGAAGETAFARGLDAPAIYFSDRGDTVATMTVVEVERGWQDYSDYAVPETGKEYVLVTVEVEMMSRGGLVLSPYAFQLFDGYGYMNATAWGEAAEDADVELFLSDVTVASGETAEVVVVFQVYEGAPLGYLLWQPGGGIGTLIDLTEVDS
jgi:hypothetical protein